MGAKLCNHRIIEHRHLGTLGDAGVIAHSDAIDTAFARRPVANEPADRGQEIAIRIFGVHARLDGPTFEFYVRLPDCKFLPCCDPDHLLDQIDPRNQLRDRMFDLKPRIHFEEVETLVLSGNKFDRTGRIVANGFGQRNGLFAHTRARLGVQQRRRRLLQDLLIAALD